MKILKVNNLHLDLKNEEVWKPILHGISFELSNGETLGIVGESGSGKSVTALSIMRLINPKISKIDEGTIHYFDASSEKEYSLTECSEKELRQIRGRKIAMIFQEPMSSLNPVIRCGKQITEAILLHTDLSKKEAKKRVIQLFEEVKLPRPEYIFNSYPHELSGGQKQRVMIAMALSCDPDILIADEPTTALDVTVQKAILELIREVQQKRGMGVIFITHDLGVISEIADRVLVLYKGTVVEEGSISDLFENASHPYTQGLLACRPPLNLRFKKLPTVENYIKQEHLSDTFKEQIGVVSKEERQIYHQKLYGEKPIIEIRNLCKEYPLRRGSLFEKREYIQAISDINLEIYEGETLGLVGESGCGKTTLGRAMIRLVEPSSGSILYRNQELRNLSLSEMRKVRKELQIILQDPYSSLNQHLTIGAMLVEPMKVHRIGSNSKERKRKAIELLERVGLEDNTCIVILINFRADNGSGSPLRALAVNPRFIICDESVSALDVSVQAQVLNLLNELKNDFGFTYLFISHDLSVVKFMSDRMAVMEKGKIVELDDADRIYEAPQTEYTQKLINAIPNPPINKLLSFF